MPVGNGTTLAVWVYVVIAVVMYLYGSISVGILYSKLFLKDDIRNHGSGNTGMTNALRSYGGKAAAVIFIGDLLKGLLGILAVTLIFDDPIASATAAITLTLGHIYPIYFQFKGGKAIATITGILIFLDPLGLVAMLIPFGLVVLITRYISAASISMTFIYPIYIILRLYSRNPKLNDSYSISFIVMTIVLAIFVFGRHKDNLKRLLNGTERKLSVHKKGEDNNNK